VGLIDETESLKDHEKFVVEDEFEICLWRLNMRLNKNRKTNKLRGFSPQANYTDRTTYRSLK
jgi:hypothetical protein